MNAPSYDEEEELRRYIRKNYMHLQTDRERQLYNGALLRVKGVRLDSPDLAPRYGATPDYLQDPDVDAVIEEGISEFQERVRTRIFETYRDRIFINRCERCDKIVASPIACTCLWCGHVWYERRSEMEAAAICDIYPEKQLAEHGEGGKASPATS
jgi:hypothetical protein